MLDFFKNSTLAIELVSPHFQTFFNSFPSILFKKIHKGATHQTLLFLPTKEPCQLKRL